MSGVHVTPIKNDRAKSVSTTAVGGRTEQPLWFVKGVIGFVIAGQLFATA